MQPASVARAMPSRGTAVLQAERRHVKLHLNRTITAVSLGGSDAGRMLVERGSARITNERMAAGRSNAAPSVRFLALFSSHGLPLSFIVCFFFLFLNLVFPLPYIAFYRAFFIFFSFCCCFGWE